jgi:hypothetical protein
MLACCIGINADKKIGAVYSIVGWGIGGQTERSSPLPDLIIFLLSSFFILFF